MSHGAVSFESPQRAVALIELFTSEGCNSCPPADAWLSSLRAEEGLWSQYVPVAFHVTYWDSLGWRDRFGQREFDMLHSTTAAHARVPVYTPGVFVAGEEWRAWRRSPHGYEHLANRIVGTLKVEIGDWMADVAFDSPEVLARPMANFAWLKADQSTQVPRGENAGMTLHHEFVVRKLQSAPMREIDGKWRASFPASEMDTANNQAVAVWVVGVDGQPVQATGGWLSAAHAVRAQSD
jgi:hypothetical protein